MNDELPAGWTVATIGDLATNPRAIAYGVLKPGENDPNGVILLRVKDIARNRVDAKDAIRVSAKLDDEFRRTRLRGGEALVSIQGTVGRVALVPASLAGANVSRTLAVVPPSVPEFASWMRAALIAPQGQDAMRARTGGTTRDSLNLEDLRVIELPVPPINEQRRIVAKLDALLARTKKAREHLDRVPALLDALKRSILAAAFRGDLTAEWRKANPSMEPATKLLERIRAERRRRWEAELRAKGKDPKKAKYEEPVSVEESELPELPEGWCWASMEELAVDGPSNGYSPATSSDATGTLSLKLTATTGGRLRLDENATKRLYETVAADSPYWLRPDDILVQRANTAEYVGTAAVFTGPLNTYVYPDLMMRVRVAMIEPQWIVDVVNNLRLGGYFSARATGTAGSMPKINGQVLRAVPVPIPPAAERSAIRDRVDLAMRRVVDAGDLADRLSRLIDRCDRSVLSAAFRGELVPQHPHDEPADVLLARVGSTGPKAPRAAARASGAAAADAAPSLGDALDVVVGAFVAANRMTADQVTAATGLGKGDVTAVLKGLVTAGKVRVEGNARAPTYVWVG